RLDALVAAKERVLGLLAEKRRALITRAVTRGLGPRAPLRDSGIPWLGEIPAHWEAMRLKRLVAIPITDGPHETPEFVSDGIEFISAEAIQEDAIDFERRRGFITPQLHAAYCRKTRPQRDDILFCKSGATTGKLARVLVDHEFSIWSPLAVIRADPHVALPAYLEVCLRADVVQDQVRQTWSAGTQPNIAMGAINELWLAVPPIGEQAAILSALDVQMTNFDEIKSKTVRTVGLLKERRAALIAAAVTGQIDVEHAA
ncbi:MAG: restriction endonuclease subunit S, partial [Candidatus Eisenbacteria bacterium]|nr:restriction endonuclease subunit S [Candidatus Eisenbacteria bacterium]